MERNLVSGADWNGPWKLGREEKDRTVIQKEQIRWKECCCAFERR